MKKIFKILLEILLIILGLVLIVGFLIFSAKSEIVPDIYVTSDSGKVALAVKGAYKWNSFSESVVVDSVLPSDYVYTNNNVLLVTPGEKMTFSNSDNSLERYKFYQLEMKYYDESNEMFEVPEAENSKVFADLKYLEINAPIDEGTYVYNFKFSYYNKGEVSYGIKIVVSTEPNYEIEDLIKYKDTKLTDAKAINNILDILPYSRYKDKLIIKTNSQLRELVIRYTDLIIDRKELINNTVALFTLIPELDLVTYISEADIHSLTRQEIEVYVGRALEDYANDVELWKKEILFKEKVIDEYSSRENIYKAIIADILSEVDNKYSKITIDTNSFKEAENIKITNVDSQEILEYVSDFSDVVYDMSLEEFKRINSDGIFIGLKSLKNKNAFLGEEASGDIANDLFEDKNEMNFVNDNLNNEDVKLSISQDIENYISGDYRLENGKYICTIIVLDGKVNKNYNYEIEFSNEKWNITELE